MEITDVTQNMLPQIFEIEKESFSLPWTLEQLASQLDMKRHVFLAAVNNGEVLGYAGLMFVLDEGYISNVAVSKKHRRSHVADALIAGLCERARKKKLSFITLEVRKSNDAARALYGKHGFSDMGVRRDYYENPREDAVICTKFLAG